MGAEFGDGGGEIVDASVFRGDCSNHWRMPAVSGHYQQKHGVDLLFEAVGAFTIGFVEDEDVGGFPQAGSHVWNVIAQRRAANEQYTIGRQTEAHVTAP